MEQQQTFNLLDILTVIFKHKWKVLVTFLVIAIGTVVVALIPDKQYVARSVIMVKIGREFIQIPEVGEGRLPSPNQEAIINTEIQLLMSPDLIGKVIDRVGVQNIYPSLLKKDVPPAVLRELAVMQFMRNAMARDVKKSNMIEVFFRHEHPGVAATVVNTLVDSLKEKHLQVFSDAKTTYLEEQLKQYEEKLKGSEAALSSFKQRHQAYSLEEQKSLLIRQRGELDMAIKAEQARIKELQQKIAFLKDQRNVFNDGVLNELRSQLNVLERKEQAMAEKYNETSKPLIDVRREIQLLREQLKNTDAENRRAEITRIQVELEPLQVKAAELRRQLGQVEGQLRALDARTGEFQDLKRAADLNETSYKTYLKKVEEARIAEDMDRKKMTNISVVQAATPPVAPAQANKKKIYGVGFFASVAVSLGLAFVAEYLPQGLTTPRAAARHLALPVLLSIPDKTA